MGIGACTAMFSIVEAVLPRPMALPAAARVVMLWPIDVRHNTVIESAYETEADFRARLRSFDDVALINSVNWSGSPMIPGREPVNLSAAVRSSTDRSAWIPACGSKASPRRRTRSIATGC